MEPFESLNIQLQDFIFSINYVTLAHTQDRQVKLVMNSFPSTSLVSYSVTFRDAESRIWHTISFWDFAAAINLYNQEAH